MSDQIPVLGLLVRSAPFHGRSGRDQLDLALSAATLGWHLELFFTDTGVLQLLDSALPGAAGLPGGLRGWRSLPELSVVRAWMSPETETAVAGAALVLPLQVLAPAAMSARLSACDHVVVT